MIIVDTYKMKNNPITLNRSGYTPTPSKVAAAVDRPTDCWEVSSLRIRTMPLLTRTGIVC